MKAVGEWRSKANAFWADMECRPCSQTYLAWVQFRKKFDGMEVKRKLTEKPSGDNKTEKERNDNGKKR